MSAVRDLPARPSLDSLRKQAKKLARDAAAGNVEAIARVHAQLPRRALPLSNRDAQLVIAREYGFAGWQDLTAEVQKRLGRGLEWAASQAKVAIHDQDHERLRALLAELPDAGLVAQRGWRDAARRHHVLRARLLGPGARAHLQPAGCRRDADRRGRDGRPLDVGARDRDGRSRNAAPARAEERVAADATRPRRAGRRRCGSRAARRIAGA